LERLCGGKKNKAKGIIPAVVENKKMKQGDDMPEKGRHRKNSKEGKETSKKEE